MIPLPLLCVGCVGSGGGGGIAAGLGAGLGMGKAAGQYMPTPAEMTPYVIAIWIILIVVSLLVLHLLILKDQRETVVPKNPLSVRCGLCLSPPPMAHHAKLASALTNADTTQCWLVCHSQKGGPKFRSCTFIKDERFANA